ncbi:MAG: hypothetical protein LCH96_18395 [Actinobacteria bacterium]|nr:hypothetical protein [Actinomycetota bacterium]
MPRTTQHRTALAPTTLTLAILAAGLVAAPPVASAAPTTPCALGTPIPGDLDGNGVAESLISQTVDGVRRYWSVAADGSLAEEPVTGAQTRFADLNGDVCSDVLDIDQEPRTTRFLLGSPDGLTPAGITIHPPEVPDTESTYLTSPVALRHDGLSQVVFAGFGYNSDTPGIGSENRTVVYVYTLDADANPGEPQVIAGATFGAQAKHTAPAVLDGSGDVAAFGSPADSVGKASGAGAVYLFSADPADPGKLVFRVRLTQDSPGVPDRAESGDGFGASLSLRDGRLAIGVPEEQLGRARAAGLVQPVRWSQVTMRYRAQRAIHQGTPGVSGSNETADRFGTAVLVTRGITASGSYDIAIGTPHEGVGRARYAGSVTVASFDKATYRTWTQASAAVPGVAEDGDLFGASLGVVTTPGRPDSVVVGAPAEDVTDCPDAGAVTRSTGRVRSTSAWIRLNPPPCSATSVSWGGWITR